MNELLFIYSFFLFVNLMVISSFTSGTRLGARRPALERPLVRVLLDDVVVVDGHRVFVDDVLVHQSGARLIVLGYNLQKEKIIYSYLHHIGANERIGFDLKRKENLVM